MIAPPPPLGKDWKSWGERLNAFLSTTRDKLRYLTTGESASDNGIFMWDESDKNPVVSIDGVWTPLGLGGGTNGGSYGMFYDTTNQIASAINTSYGVTWNSTAYSNNISINSTDTSKVDFAKSGTYHIVFTASLHSENASAKKVYFFPRIDGTDISSSSIVVGVHDNDLRQVCTRAGIFQIDAGSYLQAMWAVDDVDLDLHGISATSFSPSVPSVSMTITEVTT